MAVHELQLAPQLKALCALEPPVVNGVNPLPTRYAYGYAYGLRLRPTPAGLATLFDRPRGAHEPCQIRPAATS